MVGAMSGYYESEWEEQTAWESLSRLVYDHFTGYSHEDGWLLLRDLSSPTLIFRAARELIDAVANWAA
ncbi:hypothetical protein D3871_11510 [Noviherbaspirillum saxi]|uniref:Uncharacterized protein n=2 Tax=Noviherbaspirillum saxi TaxID=2320863 RepID=A0A3A3FSC9_9BURK|nr:hypothetical protein D3871_11510 [Noviherbaspirillum saxi]